MRVMKNVKALTVIGAVLLSGCGMVMSATQPDRIDLAQFPAGTPRAAIVQALNEHKETTVTPAGDCETRALYTDVSDETRAQRTAWYSIADGLTLYTAELVLTPLAAYQRSQQAPQAVRFCYQNDKLASNPVILR